ncbi:hypothetical protein NCLIV_002520 [Neospora caninum Liverpool]|uniref:40S ribosomal protein S4 n=1 Tax=Neospora caninum (strain Liverpool) TaxID=572307 RepID=F0V7S3_NEOCL|nr:hypothetical protein NCLIV_002520 [Neospora caninum Liverpool]CBZ49764.1 hypothetical protein NCLIV_002520 [Neospora caninum Liverpool]CEL64351.1 TPA: 40S ribosomal protein S4 [Neospora caninum Liverpool]|eukprot:XP_003879799.1 hypothetical protein NCLIV_002520 [Neospora caninum Liverpool]
MARGPRKHLKRVAAPHHWMLDKLTGHYAPRPSPGPHKLRESVPLVVLLRNRLRYALTYREVMMIVMQRLIKVDNKVRTDQCYPAGFMDVISIEKTKEHFRMLFDTKGRFVPHPIRDEEASYKLCRVKKVVVGPKGVPALITHDGRTMRYPHPSIKAHDCVRLDLNTGKIVDTLKFEAGNLAMVTGGHNVGRVGVVVHRERHLGGFDIIHLRDAKGNEFATRISNVFIIGKGEKAWISLPKEKGIRLSIMENRAVQLKKQQLNN